MKLNRWIRYGFSIAGTALLSVCVATAQEPPGGGMPGGGGQQPMPGNTAPMPNGAPAADGGANGMAMMSASSFVRKIFDNNQAQVQLSQLAQQKSTSEDVKQFSEQMVNIHNKLDQQLAPLARQLGVDQPKGPSKKDKKLLEKLQSLSGESFDSEYLQAMAGKQQESLKQFNDETKDTMNPAAQQAAQADKPVLEQNYQVLQKVAKSHNVDIPEQGKK